MNGQLIYKRWLDTDYSKVFDVMAYDKYTLTSIRDLQCENPNIVFDRQSTIEPGETKDVTVRFLINQPIEKYLNKGRKWWLHEGAKLIGEAEVL